MSKNSILLSIYLPLIFNYFIYTQIKTGPLCGNVTDSSFSIFISAHSTDTIRLTIYNDTNWNNTLYNFYCIPKTIFDTSCIFNVNGLQPGKYYGYAIYQNNDTVKGYCKTFNFSSQNYPLRIAFGSCIGYTDTIFAIIDLYKPDLTVIIGDWGYYDFPILSPNYDTFFTDDWHNLMNAWRQRYSTPILKEFLKRNPVAYIWDDHDFTANGSCAYSATYYDQSLNNPKLDTVPYNQFTKIHAKWAYMNIFPHYPLIDSSSGIFQQVKFPYSDIFLLDLRYSKDAFAKAFTKIGNLWYFTPPPGHTTLGNSQKNWLFNQLKNSPNCWKIIFSSVLFNKKARKIMDTLFAQQTSMPLYALAAMGMGEFWCGYPDDQDSLYKIVQANSINGVIIGSGDIHTSAMDNGLNSGVPETVAGALGQTNSLLVKQVSSTLNLNPYDYFNIGAQGVGPLANDSSIAFGLFEIWGCDSLVAKVINIQNNTILKMTLTPSLGIALNNSSEITSSCFYVKAPYSFNSPDGKIIYSITGKKMNSKHKLPGVYISYDFVEPSLIKICKRVVLFD